MQHARTLSTSGQDAFSLALLLFATLLVAKIIIAVVLHVFEGAFVRALWVFPLSVAPDLAFVCLFFATIWMLGRMAGRAGRLRGVWTGLKWTLAVTCIVYAVGSIKFWCVFHRPLNFEHFRYAGNPVQALSSWGAEKPFMAILAALSIPVLLVVLHRKLTGRYEPWLARTMRYASNRVALAAMIVYLGVAWILFGWILPGTGIARNPHLHLLTSGLRAIVPPSDYGLPLSSVPASPSDFDRPGAAARTGIPMTGPRPKNVMLVVLESVGSKHLHVCGSPYNTTPNMDRLRADGVVFPNTFAPNPRTTHALVSVLGSLYPRLDAKVITRHFPDVRCDALSSVLHRNGYRTAVFASGGWTYENEEAFLAHRHFEVMLNGLDIGTRIEGSSWGTDDGRLLPRVLNWIDRNDSRPFFAMWWTINAHHPYVSPQPRKRFVVDEPLNKYLNAVAYNDRLVGQLVDGLRKRGLFESTLVVVVGDHGEAFGEHDHRFHGEEVYEEDVRVPVMLIHPGLPHRGEVLHRIGGQVDVAPTIADVLGLKPGRTWQGRSLFAPTRSPRAYSYTTFEHKFAVRDPRWRFVWRSNQKLAELYDLNVDPGQLRNVADRYPQVVAEMQRRLAQWVKHQRGYLRGLGVPE